MIPYVVCDPAATVREMPAERTPLESVAWNDTRRGAGLAAGSLLANFTERSTAW